MSPQKCILCFIGLTLVLYANATVFAEAATKLKSYYSPILKLEADNGYFLISTDAGIQWIQVEDTVKQHLKTLDVGDMIDIVVELRPDKVPPLSKSWKSYLKPSEGDDLTEIVIEPGNKVIPLLKSWKLARSSSSCKIFDGKTCTQ